MSNDPPQFPTEPQAPAQPNSTPSLARRLSRRATDLFAIAILAAGTLAISSRLTEWWGTDSDDLLRPDQSVSRVVGTQMSWGAGETPVALRLGQLPVVMHRQVIVGDEDRASKMALQKCRTLLGESVRAAHSAFPIQPAEQELLDRLKNLVPTEERAGQWRLYRVDQPGSFVVGTLVLGVRLHPEKGIEPSQPIHELACWSMATPSSATQWTLFSFEKAEVPTQIVPQVPLPPNSRLILTLADPSGGQLASFDSADETRDPQTTLATWREFFDRELAQLRWQAARDWTHTPNGWSARFEATNQGCELLLNSDHQRVVGMVNVIATNGQ